MVELYDAKEVADYLIDFSNEKEQTNIHKYLDENLQMNFGFTKTKAKLS